MAVDYGRLRQSADPNPTSRMGGGSLSGQWGDGSLSDRFQKAAEAQYDQPRGSRNFEQEARALFPWLPLDLLNDFARRWAETGDPEVAMGQIRQDKATYDKYFPGNRTSDGRFRMDEANYLAYVDDVKKIMRESGLPSGFFDTREEVGELVQANMSIGEISQRINEGYLQYAESDAETKSELMRLYGIGAAEAAMFFLDDERALAVIQRDVAAAAISGSALRTGYGYLDEFQAERLASLGITAPQASEAFANLERQSDLFGDLPGTLESSISRDEQMAAAFEGDADAQRQIEERREARKAAFQGGGGATLGGRGITGLRTSSD